MNLAGVVKYPQELMEKGVDINQQVQLKLCFHLCKVKVDKVKLKVCLNNRG